MKTIIKRAVAVLGLVSTLAQAASPAWYPPTGFAASGKIDEIRTEERVLIIDDTYYRFAENLPVRSYSEQNDSLGRLRKGTTVGFFPEMTAKGERLIREIWLLPDNHVQPDD